MELQARNCTEIDHIGSMMQSVIKFHAGSYGDHISSVNASGTHFSLIIPASFYSGRQYAITFACAIVVPAIQSLQCTGG